MRKSLKWLIPVMVVLAIIIYLFSSSGMGKVATDLTQAYADQNLYKYAIEKANSDQKAIENYRKSLVLNPDNEHARIKYKEARADNRLQALLNQYDYS